MLAAAVQAGHRPQTEVLHERSFADYVDWQLVRACSSWAASCAGDGHWRRKERALRLRAQEQESTASSVDGRALAPVERKEQQELELEQAASGWPMVQEPPLERGAEVQAAQSLVLVLALASPVRG